MLYFKLVSLSQSEILLNKNIACLFVKTNRMIYGYSSKCSYILYGIVPYYIIRQTLVANGLNFSYVHVETVLWDYAELLTIDSTREVYNPIRYAKIYSLTTNRDQS